MLNCDITILHCVIIMLHFDIRVVYCDIMVFHCFIRVLQSHNTVVHVPQLDIVSLQNFIVLQMLNSDITIFSYAKKSFLCHHNALFYHNKLWLNVTKLQCNTIVPPHVIMALKCDGTHITVLYYFIIMLHCVIIRLHFIITMIHFFSEFFIELPQ